MLAGNGINQEIINYSVHIIQQRLKNFNFRQSIQFKVRSGDEALNRNFSKPEKESIIYNSLGYVIPIYKYSCITKLTI